MTNWKNYFWVSCLLICHQTIQSQSLYQDVDRLLRAIDRLEQAQAEADDSLTVQSSAEVMAILYSYDRPYRQDSILIGTWDEMKVRFAGNPLITGLIPDSLLSLPAGSAPLVIEEARRIIREIDSPSRRNILEKLYASEAISPADYLSVSQTLEKYRTPVFTPMQAMKITADNSNQNIQNGALTSQTAILNGLLNFIVDRAKDEVVINYLERLINDETPNFKMLFPTVVSEFGHTDLNYSHSFLIRLREAFYEDVQKLSVRFPLLLISDEYFKPIQADPVAYNLLALYSMISLSQFGMPVDEIIPATHRYLYDSYEESTKESNLILADKAYGTPEYTALTELSRSVLSQIKSLYLALNEAETGIGNDIMDFQQAFPDAPPPPDVNDYLGRPSYNLGTLFGDGNAFGLNLLPQLLEGQLDSAYMLQYNTLESYDRFFGRERSPQQWRAAGLELLQKLNGTWHNDQSIAVICYNWQKDLTHYQLATRKWMEEADPEGTLQRALQQADAGRQNLERTILEDKEFWLTQLNYDQRLAFNALANLVTPAAFLSIDENVALDAILDMNLMGKEDLIRLERRKQLITAVEERLIGLDTTLYARNPERFQASPLRKYLIDKQTTLPYSYLIAQIGDLEKELVRLHNQLSILEDSYARIPSRARDNARPVLQTTELVSQLMYCLRTDQPAADWINRDQLDTLLDGGVRQAAFLGLMGHRLGSVNDIGPLSPGSLAELVQMTVKDVQLLPRKQDPDSLQTADSLAFYRKASFAVNTLNRILELPLVADPLRPGYFTSLKSRSDKLGIIPDVSGQALNFIYYVNVKDHGKAISSLIRLFTNLDLSTPGTQDDNKRKPAIRYLQKYGDFIAGLIDARNQDQVQSLLEYTSEPPGSSRIKRKSSLTVGLNAYIGGTFGTESWKGDALAKDESFTSLAPTLPVGIDFSFKAAKNISLSAVVTFIDIGALVTYQPNSVDAGDTDFTFKNVFKPGVQLHWNIPKSPFYLGAGMHYGPQFQQINGSQESLGATRFFLGFGVDVPLKTFFQKE